jgi:hypothetical protein
MERVGEHAEAVWKSVKRSPWDVANFWIVGVEISPPNGDVSELKVRQSVSGVQSKIVSNYDEKIGSFGHIAQS